jgi:hypothetical protein
MIPRPDRLVGAGETSLYEERLVEDVLLLHEVLAACASDDTHRLRTLGVLAKC